MRTTRLVAAGAALIMTAGRAGSAAAARAAATFHGEFTQVRPTGARVRRNRCSRSRTDGRWNLVVNVAGGPDMARARASILVHVPGEGISARWMENELALVPLTAQSVVADVVPNFVGVVHDPADGVYAFESYVAWGDATFAMVYYTATGQFAYGYVPGPQYACPAPSDEVPECYDSVFIEGISR